MASPTQLVQMAFAGGIDQSQREEVLDPLSGFPLLENGRQAKRGGYSKRKGYTFQTLARHDDPVGPRTAGAKMFSHGKQTCVIDGTDLDAYSTAMGSNVHFGRLPECTLETMGLGGISASAPVDMAVCGGYIVSAYQSIATVAGVVDIHVTVTDADTGIVVRAPERIYSGTTIGICRLATYGTRVFAILGDTNAAVTTITRRILDTASTTTLANGWNVSANVATDALETASFCVCSLSNKIAVSYTNNSGGASQLTVKTLDSTGVLQTQTINTSSVRPYASSVFGETGDTLWVAWNQTTAVKVCGLDPANITATALASTATVITTFAPITDGQRLPIDVISHPSTAGAGRIFVNDTDSVLMRSFSTVALTVSAGGSQVAVYNALRAGRAFRYGSRYYACLGAWQGTTHAIVCDLTPDTTYVRPVAALPLAVSNAHPAAQAWVVGTDAYVPYASLTSAETGAGTSLYAMRVALVRFADSQRWSTAAHAGRVAIGGGVLCTFDGGDVAEVGFLVRPQAPIAIDSGGGAGPNGAYRYVTVYEAVDTTGTRHFSSVSDPSNSVTVVDNAITVAVRTLSISYRINATTDPNVRVSIYRTLAGGEPPYFYLASVDNALTGISHLHTDSTTDAALQANEKLYAPSLPGVNGGAQDRRPPPGLTHVISYNGMLVGSQGEDLYYSGQDVAGEGTWFSPIFQVPVSGDGPITGLAAQDGTAFVFKRRTIYAVAGEPPSDNGGGGGLGTPRRLSVDVGCIDARSIVVTGAGVFFQSERGIEVLTRSQSVMWIGEQVQDTVDAYPVISAATLDPTENLVYFECAESEVDGLVFGAGRTLVYDLSINAWVSVDRRMSYAGIPDTPAQSGCVIWDGAEYGYAWLETGGRVRPTHYAYLDSGATDTWITLKATGGWVKLSGIQGQQAINRVLLLAKKSTRADINIALAYDYNDSFETATTWLADDIDALTAALGRVQLGHDAHDDGEGQAVRVSVYDATPTGGTVSLGLGLTFVALTFEGSARPNAAQLPEDAR
jgi:hypothetical protein